MTDIRHLHSLTSPSARWAKDSSSRDIGERIHLLYNVGAFLYMCPTACNEISMAARCRGNLALVEITGPASI